MQKRFSQTGSQNSPFLIEKIIASLSYITMGFVGFIWLLIGIFTKSNLRPYLKYHVFQSIFISIAYFLSSALLGLILNILSLIPFVNQLVLQLTYYFNAPIIIGFSLIQLAVYAVIFYLVITCLQGKFSYLPFISEIIEANVKNS